MVQPIKVLFLLAGDIYRASCRYRVHQYLPYMKKIDPMLVWSALENEDVIRKAETADIVYIQKCFFSSPFLQALKAGGARLVYDFDDSVFLDSDYATAVNRYSWQFNYFKNMLRHCDLVLAGNTYLAGFADQYHSRVEIIPTTLDVKHYLKKEHHPDGQLIIGWIGHSSNLHYLELLKEPLVRMRTMMQNWVFRVVSDQPWNVRGLPVEFCRWDLHYVKELHKMDIGVMPLYKYDEWAKGKCACKALQYMAAGIPAVVSPVGMNSDIIIERKSGYFANSPNEWSTKLIMLLNNGTLRAAVGESGREFVEKYFSAAQWAVKLEELLIGVADKKR
ncbi:MAG: glycosyltransferase family 4 protein [Bacillota bacterium]